MQMTVSWVTAPCGLVETDKCSLGAYCFHRQGDKTSPVIFILVEVRNYLLSDIRLRIEYN
jgi:hypothetical protein